MKDIKLTDRFFFIWSFFIPITSFVLIPTLKGTLISYIMAFISPFIVLFYKNIRKNFIIYVFKLFFIWLFFLMISQLSNLIWNVDLSSLILINENDFSTKVFRSSIFTQTLYLIPCICLFLYVKYFYNKKWDKWIVYSGTLFAIIGLYFSLYFFLTGQNGDFISNRIFGDMATNSNIPQNLYIGNLFIQRVQSLSGEPSMYAFTILPYLIFAIHRKANKYMILIMGISLILSMSTSGFLGLLVYIVSLLCFSKINKDYIKYLIIFTISCFVIYIVFSSYIDDIVVNLIVNKITGVDDPTNLSGIARSKNFYDSITFWSNLDILHILFGIGFGVIRSTDLLSTFLVNIGVIGTVMFSYFYLSDIKLKNITLKKIGDNSIILSLFTVAMISVPEFSYLSFWLFLGIIKSKNNLES